MKNSILFILAASLLVFGAIAYMATAKPADIGAPVGGTGSGSDGIGTGVGNAGLQVVSVHATGSGYDHSSLQVRAGTPVEFHFSATNAGCGSQLILDGFNVNLVSRNGEDQVARFTPTQPGTYAYHCGMNMFRGTLSVV